MYAHAFNLEPRPSNLKAAGQGLFLRCGSTPVPSSTILCSYTGTLMTMKEALAANRTEGIDTGYMMRLGSSLESTTIWINALNHSEVLARFINDPRTPLAHNVTFVKDPLASPPRAEVVALRDLVDGEEIFVDYGKWYWAGERLVWGQKLKPIDVGRMYAGLEVVPDSADAKSCVDLFKRLKG